MFSNRALDQASDLEQLERESAIDAIRARIGIGESRAECQSCGNPIPEARRQAVAGCQYCIVCQTNLDKISRRTR